LIEHRVSRIRNTNSNSQKAVRLATGSGGLKGNSVCLEGAPRANMPRDIRPMLATVLSTGIDLNDCLENLESDLERSKREPVR